MIPVGVCMYDLEDLKDALAQALDIADQMGISLVALTYRADARRIDLGDLFMSDPAVQSLDDAKLVLADWIMSMIEVGDGTDAGTVDDEEPDPAVTPSVWRRNIAA